MASRSFRPWIAGLVVVVAGCASSPAPVAPRLDVSQLAALKQAERLYRAGDARYAATRDVLARDPATAFWLTRMFVDDLVRWIDTAESTDQEFLDTLSGRQNPLESAPMVELRALGRAAVPAIAADMLPRRDDRRRLGMDILVAIGPAVLAALEPMLASSDWRVRQQVVDVAGGIAGPEAEAVLVRSAEDARFTVRASALRGLAWRGAASAARMRRAVATDSDQFVRRVAAEELAAFADRETAAVLVSYYADSLAREDSEGVRIADRSLRVISGTPRAGSLPFWRAWLSSWSGGEGR